MLSTGFKSYRKRGPIILVFGEINFLCRPEGCCYDKNKVSQFITEVEKQKTKIIFVMKGIYIHLVLSLHFLDIIKPPVKT